MINILPGSVDVEKLSYRTSPEGRLIVTDDETFVMDVNEFSRDR